MSNLPFDTNLPFEWFILLLRILFVFLLYFFLFQIVRTIARELRAVSLATSGARPLLAEEAPRSAARLIVEDAQEAGLPPAPPSRCAPARSSGGAPAATSTSTTPSCPASTPA